MSAPVYVFGALHLDAARLLLSAGDAPLSPGPRVVATLLALVERPGDVVSKEEILDRVWPHGFVEEANVTQNIYVLRKTLRAYGMPHAIRTIPRRGYRFTAPVSRLEMQPAASTPGAAAPLARRRLRYAAGAAAAVFAGALAIASPHTGLQSHTARTALSPAGARSYALGRYYWDQRTRPGLERGIRYFKQVIASDPRDARGYAALAETYGLMGDYAYGPSPVKAWYAWARTTAEQAVRVDPSSAEAHAALGFAIDLPGAEKRAQREYRTALALDPSLPSAHLWYGTLLFRTGRVKASVIELQRAAQLDPVSVAAAAWLSEAAYYTRRYNDAIAFGRQTLELSPTRPDVNVSIGLALEASGRYREAIKAFDRYGRGNPIYEGEAAALKAYAYALARNPSSAAAELERAKNASPHKRADPEDLALALVATGHRAEALVVLRKMPHKFSHSMLAFDARLDPVRNDPAFRPYI